MAAKLAPGQRARVRAQLEIDPFTPPGTYVTELDLGERRAPVVVHVFEKANIILKPRSVRLRGAPGDVLAHPLIVTNHGNITYTVPEVVLVHLEERDWFGRSLVFALRDLPEGEGHGAYLDRVVREMKATDTRPARVTLDTEPRELPPGATREVRLEMTLPQELIKGRTYIRAIPFMSTQLTFVVECNGTHNSKKRRPR